MASLPNTGGPAGLPLSLIAQAIPRLTRNDLEALTERLIEHLDDQDGDQDLEPDDEDSAVDDEPCDEADQDREPEDYLDEFADPVLRIQHRRRIQQTRCYANRRRLRDRGSGAERIEVTGYELFYKPTVPSRRQLLKRKRGVPRRPRS